MIKIGNDTVIIESKVDFLANYDKDVNKFNNNAFCGFDKNNNFPIVVKLERSWNYHSCGIYRPLNDTDLIRKTLVARIEEYKNLEKRLENYLTLIVK